MKDVCHSCGEPRFVETVKCGRTVLEPYQYFIDLGIDNAIRELFNNPEWCRQRGKCRDERGQLLGRC